MQIVSTFDDSTEKLQEELKSLSQELDACLSYFLSEIEPLKKKIAERLITQIFALYEGGPSKEKLLQKLDRLPFLISLEETIPDLRKIIEEVQGVDCDEILEKAAQEFEKELESILEKRKKEPQIDALYKRLAKMLHPDLEQDEGEKERKLHLMQTLTSAYETQDIHTLILLEEKWGDGSACIPDEALKKRIKELPQDLKYAPIHAYISLPFFKGLSTMQKIYDDLIEELRTLEQEDL